jgi:hypothetical protein
LVIAAFAVASSCNSLVGNGDVHPASDASADDGGGDVTAPDGADGNGGPDAPQESGVVTTYNDLGSLQLWQSIDLGKVNSDFTGYVGGAFDGRYLYFAPSQNGLAQRYDTQAAFDSATSWAHFDTTTLKWDAQKFWGAVFDGRYVYFVPEQDFNHTTDAGSYTTYGGVVARFDTKGTFTDATAWAIYDTTDLDSNAGGFAGAAFDGQYIYFADHENNSSSDDTIARYDQKAPFTTASSWSLFKTGSFDSSTGGFTGALFDGRYIYFGQDDTGSGRHVQYDTKGAFGTAAPWLTFVGTTLNPLAVGYSGMGFDGHNVYFAPSTNNSGPHGLALRYDSKQVFALAAAWTLFDTSALVKTAVGFAGTAFDGRYMYFAPHDNGANSDTLVRFDTHGTFTDATAWGAFSTKTVDPNAYGFFGALFDGQYVYFVPNASTVVVRFKTKTPASMPPGYSGSFL